MRKRKPYSTNSSKVSFSVNRSVMVGRSAVLASCFDVVMVFTKALPVALIPEQLLVATVGDDVIHHRCFGVPSLPHALHTQWMALEVGFACLLPSAAIATLGCGTCHLRVKRQVLYAVQLAGFHQLRASGLVAWNLGFPWHWCHLLFQA